LIAKFRPQAKVHPTLDPDDPPVRRDYYRLHPPADG
jgi:hypothetical protein